MDEVVYNILWLDDEHEQLAGTKGRAKRNGINLIPFKSLDGGISELERNYPNYDGVLLDAKFFENETDEAGSEDTFSSFRAKERILQLPKKFEIFVLTGQAEAYENIDNLASKRELQRPPHNQGVLGSNPSGTTDNRKAVAVCSSFFLGKQGR